MERLPAEVAAEDCDVQLGIAALAALFMVRTTFVIPAATGEGLDVGLAQGRRTATALANAGLAAGEASVLRLADHVFSTQHEPHIADHF